MKKKRIPWRFKRTQCLAVPALLFSMALTLTDSAPAPTPLKNTNTSFDEQFGEIKALHARITKTHEHCFGDAEYQTRPEGCISNLKYDPGLHENINSTSNGKRVLILDNGMEITSMLRLASRLVALYRANDQGTLIIPYASGEATEYILPVPLINGVR